MLLMLLIFYFIFIYFLSIAENSGCLTWVRHSSRRSSVPIPISICIVFTCIQTMAWRPVFGIFNVRTGVGASDSTLGLCRYRKRVCTGSWFWEKNSLPHRGLETASVLRLAFQSVSLPAELSLPLVDKNVKKKRKKKPKKKLWWFFSGYVGERQCGGCNLD